MHLKLRQIEVFHTLMKAGSVSQAAERLNLSQPAVSVALANLEQEVGFKLFHRSKGFFAPTNEAVLLYAEAEQSLLSLNRLESRARSIRAGTIGAVTMASNGAVAINLLPWVIAEFTAAHPHVTIDLKLRDTRTIASWVGERVVDLGLIDAPAPVAGLEVETFRIPCEVLLRADDPLAAHPVLTPKLLEGRTMIGITGDHSVDRQMEQAFFDADVLFERRITCSYFAIARNMARAGAGIAIIDRVNARPELGDDVVARPFEPTIIFEFAIVYLRNAEMPPSVARFLDLLCMRLKTFVDQN
ncbi:MAG: LysR family transcriptional regulator [Rhizobiales bacterium]|nr:LysR family transcriptional regulator [Hyphomicrobiales bacterium]